MVNIIGAGLAGSILKRVLDNNKIPNNIFDCKKDWRASPISENLFSLSWSSTLGNKVVTTGIKTLESIVDIKAIRFETKAGFNNVLHVHPNDILIGNKETIKLEVPTIWMFKDSDVVVDCRGYWASIPDKEKMVGLAGQGFFVDGWLHKGPVMNLVVPYTHQKLFQWDTKDVWYGDSTCIELSKYLAQQQFYVDRCEGRCRKLIRERREGTLTYMRLAQGIRPWVKGHKGYLKINGKRIINTGGWKCGLIIYSEHANRILKHLKKIL